MNVSKIRTLIPAPESAFHIELSNDNSQVNCDYAGNPIAGAVYEPSVISLWYGASDAWSQFNVTVVASGISSGYNSAAHSLNPSAITKDTATIKVTARHKTRTHVVLQATYTVSKNKAGSPGATPVSYSLKPSLHVIRKSSDGTLLDTEISFEVHKRAGTVLTVISTFGTLYDNALDIKIGEDYIGDAQKGDQEITVATADFWTNANTQNVRLEHEVDTSICYDNEHIGVVTDGEDGQDAASGLFIPAIIWVEADENGWSKGKQTFNITPSVVVDGVPSGFETPLDIISSPHGVTATFNESLGLIVVTVPDDTDPVEYQGEVMVGMQAIVGGKIYAVRKGIPIVPNIEGKQGNGIVSITRTYAISNVGTVATNTTEPAHQGNWQQGSPAVTDEYPYLWRKVVTVFTDTSKNTTIYECMGKKGDSGIDGAGSEWVYIRTKTEVAPMINDAEDPVGEDSNGHHYEHEDYLPTVIVESGEVEPNNIANRSAGLWNGSPYGECTDDQKGVTETWPYEWVAKRENVLKGTKRVWQSYVDATKANDYKMSLHARYSKDGEKGEDGVTYEILPSVSSIRADKDGNVQTGVIQVSAYKIKGESRTSCGLGVTAVLPSGQPAASYWAQYRIDGGTWTNCSNIAIGGGHFGSMLGYGVPASAVSTITYSIAFRLLYGTSSSSYSVVHEMAPLQVVKDGQTGAQGKTGRFYYYDGYFNSSKEYTATDHQAPYVAFDYETTITDATTGQEVTVVKTSYHMLVTATNMKDGSLIPPRPLNGASGIWEEFESSHIYLMTQVFFTAFAKLGSAVFSGDWMISQNGKPGITFQNDEKNVLSGIVNTRKVTLETLATLKNSDGTYKTANTTYTTLKSYYAESKLQKAIDQAVWAVENDATIDQLLAMSATSYQLFGVDESNPFKLFAPNIALDFLTGKGYLHDADIEGTINALTGIFRGTVYATAGKFTGEIEADTGHVGGFNISNGKLTAASGPLSLGPNGIEFRDGNGNVVDVSASSNVIAAFGASNIYGFDFMCAAQFSAKGAKKLNAAIDIPAGGGVFSGYVPVVTTFSNNITIVCDNNVSSDTNYTKHVRSGGVFLPIGNSQLTVTLPNKPANGTQYTIVKTNNGNTVVQTSGTDKIAVNTKYESAGTSYTLNSFARLVLTYYDEYWYGNI